MSFVVKDSDGAAVTVSRGTDYVPVLNSRECTLRSRSIARRTEPRLKRIFDIALSVAGLILSAWLWSVISIMIISEDGMPVIIRQRRIGKGGKRFDSFKFRSMIKATSNDKVDNQAVEHDRRVTKVGRFLRRTALDELPQLLNILRGDMSFVGPRPLLSTEVEVNGDPEITDIEAIPNFIARAVIRPGLTGVAQVFAPRDIPRKHKFRYDLLYTRKMSFRYDLVLIMLSFLITFSCTWEKRTAKLPFLRRDTGNFDMMQPLSAEDHSVQ
jgi:lipopolysaccharide/colanic/teichoic acid biosynthesis glycosyltransferase